MVVAKQLTKHVVPATVVVAHAVVLRQARDEGTEADALVVIETAAMGVLVEEHHRFRILLTGL